MAAGGEATGLPVATVARVRTPAGRGDGQGHEQQEQDEEGHDLTILPRGASEKWQKGALPTETCHTRNMALNDVVAVVADGFAAFELGVVCEVFGYDRSEQGLPKYDFAVVAAEEPPLTSGQGFRLDTDHRLDRMATADLVCIPA